MRLLTLFLLMRCCTSYAQEADTIKKYLDENLHLTSKEKMVYPALEIRDNDHWYLTANYPGDSGVMFKIYFKDNKLTTHDGAHILYFPGNKKSEELIFINNIANGNYIDWYDNGNMKDSGNFINGYKEGLWKSWYSNGLIESAGDYKTNKADGEWNWYRENGKQATKEIYTNAKISKLECYNENGDSASDNCSIAKPPVALGNFTTLETYLQDNIIWSKEMLDSHQDGTWVVKMEFMITKDGRLTNFKIIQSPNQAFSKEAERLIKLVSKWSPCVSHNRLLDYTMEYEIAFTLNN